MIKTLVTGAKGQLGFEVVKAFQDAGHIVLACDREQLDITNIEQCQFVTENFLPDVIVHCAAYTAVDDAERYMDRAYKVNAIGARNMAVTAQKHGVKLLYVSTDYVFDGLTERAYEEYENTNPVSVYGKSKRAGELLVQSLCSRWFIVRTSWLYGMHGQNFVKTIIQHAQQKPLLRVVNDQTGSPTYALDLAQFLLQLACTEKYGIYHASNTGSCTWYEFATAILEQMRLTEGVRITGALEPCTSEQFLRPAHRPPHSVMEHRAIQTNDLQDLRPWRPALNDFIEQYCVSLL